MTQTKPFPAVPKLLPRLALPVAAGVLFTLLLADRLRTVDSQALWHAFAALSPGQIALAALLSYLSLRAVGQYDALIHGLLDTGVGHGRARRAGTRAIALSQTLGCGALTGALVRWRLLPDLSLGASLRLSVLVGLSFLGAMGLLLALVLPLSGLAVAQAGWALPLGLGVAALLIGAGLLAHRMGWVPRPLTPSMLGRLLLAATVDTACAAGALWVLWPDATGPGLVFAVYLVALGAGLLSNAPGGVGAFDLTLLALLPQTPEPAALASLVAFRAIYYALPACLAAATLLWPEAPPRLTPAAAGPAPDDPPEAALRLQGARVFAADRRHLALTPPGVLAIKGPAPTLAELSAAARDAGRRPALYQCAAPIARQARDAGWAICRVAQEALIDPATWSPDRPACRQLRRKLRSFQAAGLTISRHWTADELGPVAADWARAHGGERGLTMGRFCPGLLRRQVVFVAREGARPLAFVTFHRDGPRWTLDLVRHIDPLPNGTLHALIVAGIERARAEGASQMSLAAVPDLPADPPLRIFPGFAPAAMINAKGKGLRQFKSSFAPDWQPRYLCAPSLPDLGLAAISLALAVRFPPRLPPAAPQDHDARNSFETLVAPCHPQPCILAPAGGSDAHQRPDPIA